MVFDIDGTREAARQRALPKTPELPAPQRRLGELCAPGYTGRKRGEIVRTRTVISQAHTSQWLGSFANPGNGLYREELRRAVAVIHLYSKAHDLPGERVLLRLDGQYGTGAVLADLAGSCYVMRGKDYTVLDRTEVQSRLHLPPDQQFSRPESNLVRALYDCPDVPVGPTGQRCRVVVATHPTSEKKSRVGLTRSGLIYELFFTDLPQSAFTAADVVALYLHRGAFEPALADEDQEQDPDRWCSHSPCGQDAWHIVSQWVWNLRLELGHHLEPTPMRTTAFAPAPEAKEQQAPSSGYGPPTIAAPWKAGRLSGQDFVLQPDGTLRCPANQALSATEQRREADGSLRLVYAAKMSQCRPCPLREQCQWHGRATTKPRRVSLLLHPLQVGSAPLLWKDWSRRQHRRACMGEARATNGWRSHFRRLCLPSHKAWKSFFPVRSAPIIASRGKNDWRAMLVLLPLTDPPSSSLASQKPSPFSSVCRRRKEALAASGCPLLGQVHLSEWHLMALFPGFPFVPLICRSFRSKFCCFCRLTGALRPELCVLSFEDTTQGSLHLVAQFVGIASAALPGPLVEANDPWRSDGGEGKGMHEAQDRSRRHLHALEGSTACS